MWKDFYETPAERQIVPRELGNGSKWDHKGDIIEGSSN